MATNTVEATQSQLLFSQYGFYDQFGRQNGEMRKILQKHNYPKDSFLVMMDDLGLSSGSNGMLHIAHQEEDWLFETFSFDTIVTASTGAGTSVVVQLSNDSMRVDGGFRRSYPMVGNIIKLSGGVRARVTAKNTTTANHQLTLEPLRATDDLATAIVTNLQYSVTGNAHGEGTRGVKGRLPNFVTVENYYQIFKQGFATTGTGATLQAPYKAANWVNLGSIEQTGQSVFVMQGASLAEATHMREISMSLVDGIKSNSLTEMSEAIDAEVPIFTTHGLLPSIVDNGGAQIEYENTGFTMANFDEGIDRIENERIGCNTYYFLLGNKLYKNLEDLFVKFGVDNFGVYDYAKSNYKDEVFGGMNADAFFTSIGFSGIRKRGQSIIFKSLTDFNDPKGLGNTTYDTRQIGVLIPHAVLSQKNDETVTSLGYKYRSLGNYSRKMEITTLSGTNLTLTQQTDLDMTAYHLRSEIGGDFALMNQCSIFKPKA